MRSADGVVDLILFIVLIHLEVFVSCLFVTVLLR